MKIEFTKEHESKLKELFLELGFSGFTIPGKFGANSYNVIQLLHTTDITSLQVIYIDLERDIEKLGKINKWTSPQASKLENLKKWYEFIDLLIGYKLYNAQQQSIAEQNKKEKAEKLKILKKAFEAKEIERINSLSQEELDAEIAKLSN